MTESSRATAMTAALSINGKEKSTGQRAPRKKKGEPKLPL